jgi:hypothetical protein
MTSPSPDTAFVLWNKMQNYAAAFLSEIAAVRTQLGDDRSFANWCFNDLHIPLATITRVTDVLQRVDAERNKRELAAARAAEEAQRAQTSAARKAALEADRQRRAEEKAAAAAEKARLAELDKQQRALEKKKASKKKNNKGYREKQRRDQREAFAALAAATEAPAGNTVVPFRNSPMAAKTEAELVREIKAAIKRRDASREQWIDASVELGGLLVEARSRYPADQKFSNWLKDNNIDLNPQDRAALLHLGLDMKAMRIILQQTDRTNYRRIWDDVKPQITGNPSAPQHG